MNDQTAATHPEQSPVGFGLGAATREVTGYWWLWLLAGIAWTVIALVILQFDQASITTVGILVGLMFTLAGVQSLALATAPGAGIANIPTGMRWVSGIFGVLFLISAVVCFISPENTFAGLADSLGFLFLIVAVWWIVRAFLEREFNSFWWLGLISGILMTILAYWTAGQFFIEKAYVLLVFAGVWALLEGIADIVRAFAVLDLHEQL
ncbi:MAG TPA: DUF308 domain-containing protein [Solirubrobacterales bacterium]